MAYRYQLSEAKTSALREIAGVCPDSTKFVSLVNEAQRRLMRRGNWEGTEVLVRLCAHDACLTWPRYVKNVLGVRVCQGITPQIQNHWYEVIGPAKCNGWRCDSTIVNTGQAPTYRKISGSEGRLIRYYVVKRNDVGKTVTIFGKQYGGQPLQERVDGVWRDGLTITAAAPFGSTSVAVTEITRVVRQTTEGLSYLYEYDADEDQVRDIAMYEPNETNPLYLQSKIQGFCNLPRCNPDSTELQSVRFEALVKLSFVPVTNDWDFLAIDNFEALKFAIQAIRLEEANDDALGEAKMIKAIRELNFDLRDQYPDEQVPVRMRAVLGGGIVSPI